MKKIKWIAGVTSLKIIETRKEDVEMTVGQIHMSTKKGEKIVITGDSNLLDGFSPKEQVTIELKRDQKTIEESIEKE